MKKEYTTPKAEKFDFNYTENVVASDIVGWKGKDNPGCYKGADGPDKGCEYKG